MKNFITIYAIIMLTSSILAQSPEKMSYQAVVRNSTDKLIVNQLIGMRISILQTTPTGTAVYKETQTSATNVNGLLTIEIGAGTTTDVFSAIDWSKGPYFIKTEIDPTGGTTYSITATSQLLSVPYALNAKNVQNKQWTESGSSIYFNTGKVGIGKNPGTDSRQFQVFTENNMAIVGINKSTYGTIFAENSGTGPAADFRNKLLIMDGTQGAGKVLTSDAGGYTSWQTPLKSIWETNESNIYYSAGNVAIGILPIAGIKFRVKCGNDNAGNFENNGTYTTLHSKNTGTGSAGAFSSSGTAYTLYASNTGTGPAAYFDGSLQVAGGNTAEINRTQTGTANIVPVCYGSVEANGTLNTGGSTPNFTVTRLSTGVYEITLTGETYSQSTHCAIASLGDPGFINTNTVTGKLRINTYTTDYVTADREFSFVVFKP